MTLTAMDVRDIPPRPLEGRAESSADLRHTFMRLAKEHEAVLVRVARRLCHPDNDLADDCVQEALVAGFRSVAERKFSDFDNFRPWMLRIVSNVFYRQSAKQRKHRGHEPIEEWSDSLAASVRPVDVERVVELTALQEEIDVAMACLSEEQRSCVVLVDIEETPYEEAAAILGVPIGTVRSRLNRARLRMADVITRHRLLAEEP